MRSDFLFASPSLLFGVGRLADLFGQFDLFNQSPTGDQADLHAMSSDWAMIGLDLCSACEEFARANDIKFWIEGGKVFAQIGETPPEAVADSVDCHPDVLAGLSVGHRHQDAP
jgi:hypothetical protein